MKNEKWNPDNAIHDLNVSVFKIRSSIEHLAVDPNAAEIMLKEALNKLSHLLQAVRESVNGKK